MTLKVSREKALEVLLELLELGVGRRAVALSPGMDWDQLRSDYARWNTACAEKLEEIFEPAREEPEFERFFGPSTERELSYWQPGPIAEQELQRLYDERIGILIRVHTRVGELAQGAG